MASFRHRGRSVREGQAYQFGLLLLGVPSVDLVPAKEAADPLVVVRERILGNARTRARLGHRAVLERRVLIA